MSYEDEELAGPTAADTTLEGSQGVEVSELAKGTTLGRYVVLHRIGAGGMGVVYAAYDPDLDRRVALKLVRPRGGSRQTLEHLQRRMMREAQAMAKLVHPNVVKVHDVGEHQGQLYLALDFVEGETSRHWLRAQSRGWREVLDVFVQAGRGLEAAHAAGIVHRDFKPDNVLVASDGHARVTDFGLARALDRSETTSTELEAPAPGASGQSSVLHLELSDPDVLAGTPAYMAPEQFAGRETDARTDQFAFCVALWEALQGERPFEGASLEVIASAVADERTRPWTRRRGAPPFIGEALRRGLRRDPQDRWPSMGALLEALSRDHASHRIQLASIALALVGVSAVAFFVLRGASQESLCPAGAAALEGTWDEARSASIERAVLDSELPYAPDLWPRLEARLDAYARAWGSSYEDACADTRIRGEQSGTLMDGRMKCLEGRRRALAALVNTLADASPEAVEHGLQSATDLPPVAPCDDADYVLSSVPPPDPSIEREVETLRETVARALASGRAGEYEAGLATMDTIAARATELGYAPLVAEIATATGRLQNDAGRYEEAYRTLSQAFNEARREGLDELAAEIGTELVSLLAVRRDRPGEALSLSEVIESEVDRFGTLQLRARLHRSVGSVHRLLESFDEAIRHFSRALEIHRSEAGHDDLYVASTLAELGSTAAHLGDYDLALQHLQEASSIYDELLGGAHPEVAFTDMRVAQVHMIQGDNEAALTASRRAVATLERALGKEHPALAGALEVLGTIHHRRGDFDGALEVYERGRAILEKSGSNDTTALADVLQQLAIIHYEKGAFEKGFELHARSIAIYERAFGEAHSRVGAALASLAIAQQMQGAYDEAATTYERALSIQRKALGEEHPEVIRILGNLGGLHQDQGNYSAALEALSRSLQGLERALGPAHPDLAVLLTDIGEAHLDASVPDKALEPLQRALRIRLDSAADEVLLAETEFALARALWDTEADRPRARALARSAIERYEGAGARGEPYVRAVRDWIDGHE